jgi:hypothetical protein
VSWKAGRGALESSRFSAFQGGGTRQNDLSALGAAGHCSEVVIGGDKKGRDGIGHIEW